MVARAGFLADRVPHPADHPSGVGEHIPADPTGQTAVAGIWVAGNVTDLSAQVRMTAAAGAFAAAQINLDLIAEQIQEAVAVCRAGSRPRPEARPDRGAFPESLGADVASRRNPSGSFPAS